MYDIIIMCIKCILGKRK